MCVTKNGKPSLGSASGSTKHHCFIYEWENSAKAEQWTKKDWPLRKALVPEN